MDPMDVAAEPRAQMSVTFPAEGSLFRPTLLRIGSQERRPKQERDSLRSRSNEGRPGSRKHRRYSHSVELVSSLRRLMASRGEDNLPEDMDSVREMKPEWRPSAFYRLIEYEGADALEAWAAAESRALSPRQRPKPKRKVRKAFRDTWQYLSRDSSSQELIARLENLTAKAFGEVSEEALLWLLSWEGDELTTKSGAPPACEMVLLGLNPAQRKVVHQLAALLGLHSESRLIQNDLDVASDEKVLALRPPKSLKFGAGGTWAAPFSVTKVLNLYASNAAEDFHDCPRQNA